MKIITESNFLSEAKKSNLLLVEFRSELCAPCIRQSVVLEDLEKRIKVVKINFFIIFYFYGFNILKFVS